MSSRRTFLKQSLAATTVVSLPHQVSRLFVEPLPFVMSLNPGAIGVSMPIEPLLEMASRYGFKAITPDVAAFRKLDQEQRKRYLNKFKQRKMTWDAAGLPFNFRESAEEFKKGIGQLIYDVETLKAMGVTRMSTWIMPTHNKYNYHENLKLHRERLAEIASRLLLYDIKLGLEYVGPKTLVERDNYVFIHNMAQLKELIESIDMPNVGYQLDAFHWYCAGESVEDIKSLKPEQIITVDLNDAKAGRTREEQLDWERELPGKSGVIDLTGFLTALKEIGYEGPVRAEPFNKELGEMDNVAAIAETAAAMKRSFLLATE